MATTPSDDAAVRTLVIAPGANQPAHLRPRKMYTVSGDHKHAPVGQFRIQFTSWAKNATFADGQRMINRHRHHSGFPHALRLSGCNAVETWAVTMSPFDVCAEIRYLQGGKCENTDVLLAHANEWVGGTSADASELRFEMYLINARGDGRYGAAERPFACDDERSQFRPGVAMGRSATGKNVTNLFKNFDTKTCASETFYGTCKSGMVVFKDVVFRSDALSSNVALGDGAFRFVVRATHPALKDLVNFTAITEPFFVGARIRPTREQTPRAAPSAEGNAEA